MLKKINKKDLALIIICLAIVLSCVILSLFFFTGKNNAEPSVAKNADQKIAADTPEPAKEIKSYAGETIYTGNLSQYDELYEIPFKRTEFYISNKKLVETEPDLPKLLTERSVNFFNALLGQSAKDIAVNKTLWKSGALLYMDPNDYKLQWQEDGHSYDFIPHSQYIESIGDYIVKNNVSMEVEFITDESLVYSDVYLFCRGMLVFTINHNDDKNCKYQEGIKYEIPIDVAYKSWMSDEKTRVYQIEEFEKPQANTVYVERHNDEGSHFEPIVGM